MDITGNQTVRLRMPVAAASEIDGSKKKGVFAFSTTDQTVAVCPEDGANFVRMGIHPADAPAASSLGGGDIVLIVQGGILKRTTVSEIGGGGVWQPLDSDLTAIAALTTTSFGRSLLTLADAPSARSAIGAASSADLSGYQPLDSDLTAIAALTTTPFGRSLLALADGPAVRTAIGAGTVQPSDLSAYQPLDSDLTAIAALTTTPFGRSLLTLADAAAARSAIGAGTSSFSGAYASLSGIPAAIDAIDGLTPAADRIPYYTGASTGALTALTAFARTLMDDADAATARGTIGAMATANPNFTGTLSGQSARLYDLAGPGDGVTVCDVFGNVSRQTIEDFRDATLQVIPWSAAGIANGVAELGADGRVPATQLPSYVDDVLEYANLAAFPATGETGKIYVNLDQNKTWRWSGSGYTEISASLALGEASATAYRGDRGKTAYDHSQATGNPHGTTAAQVGAAAASHTHAAGDVTSGTFAEARIPALPTSRITGLDTALAGKSDVGHAHSYLPINNPTFTGSLTGPTQYLEADEQILLAIRRPGGQSGRIHGVAFHAQNDASAWVEFGRAMAYISSVTAGAHTGGMRLMAYKDGAILQALDASADTLTVPGSYSGARASLTEFGKLQALVGDSNYAAIYGTGVTPAGSNYALRIADNNDTTGLNATASVFFAVGGVSKVAIDTDEMNLASGVALKMAATTVIDSSRNIAGATLKATNGAGTGIRPAVWGADGTLDDQDAAEFRTIIAAAAADHNHAGIYAPVPAQTSKSGNWALDANTTTGILQTSTGTMYLPAASATYASKSYIVTASTTLTLTIAGTFCYLDANNSASYWYDTATSVAFAMHGGHAPGQRKKIEIWCDGSEWLVKC